MNVIVARRDADGKDGESVPTKAPGKNAASTNPRKNLVSKAPVKLHVRRRLSLSTTLLARYRTERTL